MSSGEINQQKNDGWYPELEFLTVVFSNSTDLAVVISSSTVKIKLFRNTTSWKPYLELICTHFSLRMLN